MSPKIPVDATMKYVLEVTDPTGRHQIAYSKAFAATASNRKQNVTLASAGVIRGKVTTKDGDMVRPATHVVVTANNSVSVAPSSLGKFSLGGLPSGTYTLLFEDYDEDGTRPGPLFSSICYDNIPRPGGSRPPRLDCPKDATRALDRVLASALATRLSDRPATAASDLEGEPGQLLVGLDVAFAGLGDDVGGQVRWLGVARAVPAALG